MTAPKSNEILAQDIAYIKEDLADIKKKLDTKYVSHETFEITMLDINKQMQLERKRLDDAGKLVLAAILPIYGAVIGLLFRIFTA